ncbi:phage tail protein [Haemophilus sp. SZY H51]|uniref:host specificity protein J n=1 Tax=Haemophilus sp. SZY H51 TaxID=3041427 RepID=UPI0025B15FBF|nr:phage tail protein [Haemophilus sp. SZY H51]MDN3211460.1 phage tail protein [Haemophilus sp. SZY H51]
MGKGGGGGGHTPFEAKESGRSKQLVKIVEAISEGEVYGLADGMKSIYFDKTPVQNKDGSYNFKNVQVEGRIGGQVQDLMAGFNTSEKEVGVGTLVKKNLPLTRTVTDSKVSRLRLTIGVQSLFKQEDNGDTNGTSVNFIITIGSRTYPVSISGKYSSQYLQHHTFDNLPSVPFIVKVERTTDDSTTQRLQNNTIWSSYTEIIDTEFTYPNTALMGVKFDSEYFSNIPTRTYDLLGLKVKVPSNYDTRTRKYTGMWDGTFKIDWTDNPAWVLYDVVTNKRYGLGGRLGEFGADKWALYQVAQYCDQLVPDGFGGQEPRFTCNVWLTEQRSAYQVINDICSIFRAMPVWNGQQLTVVMDRPADPVWTYTNANVDESGFNYTFSAKKSRHNAIQVEYADKDNSYERAIEYVSDDESIRKNGLNVKKITAFGCTSRGQAHRTGLWLLQTEKLETKTVTFTVGAEGLMHVPGDIIKVADTYYAGTNVGGRVLAINGKKVTLDREISVNGNSYFSYINAQAKHQDIKIISANGAEVTLEQNPAGLEAYGVWSLSTQQVTSQLFKAISVKEETKGKYTITALQHEPQKEAIVDNGAKFEPKATSILSAPQVSNIGVTVNSDGSVSFAGDITGGNGVIKYDFRIYKDGALFDVRLGQTSPNLNLDNLENGEYSVLIQVKNEKGQVLSERTQTFVIDKPPAPTGVRVTGGLGNITIEWDWVNDATATEIFASETDDIKTATRLTKVTARMFTHEVGAKKVRYYWLRHTRGVNIGPFSQQGGLRGESSVDIDAELEILNKKLSKNIIDEVFDTALPARNLDLIKTVNGLNTGEYQGHKQVYNTADGKLYTWNGSRYESGPTEFVASAIRGKISPAQLADIPSTKITGQLQANQIAGALSIAQIPNIPTSKLSGTIGANLLQANSIGANIIQAGAIGANHLQANSVGATQLQSNSVGANVIQANAVSADKLQANSITSAKIKTGAIRAEHIATTQITGEKLALGLGGNLLRNPLFTGNSEGWHSFVAHNEEIRKYWTKGSVGVQYENLRYNTNQAYRPRDSQYKNETFSFARWAVNGFAQLATDSRNNQYWVDNARVFANVITGKTYIFSAYVGCHHCGGYLIAEEYSANRENYVRWIANSGLFGERDRILLNNGEACVEASSSHFANGVDTSKAHRAFVKFTAPKSGVVCLIFRIARFGYKQAYQDCYMARAMLEEVNSSQNVPSPWRETSITSIDGGSIVTNSITTKQLGADSVTANNIAVGAVAAKHIAAGSIGADHIATRSLTADKLNVTSISSINANLGAITGGSLKIGSLNGNFGTLFEVQSNGGFRLISRDASGGIELSSATRALHVWDGGTEVVKVGKLS